MTISEFSKIVVSVPSRGLSYLNEILSMMDETGEVVSVPSRGLSYLNGKTKSYKHTLVVVSVPSRGLSYLNARCSVLNFIPNIVSVPSRGLSYLNSYISPRLLLLLRFRPLTGTLLSKHHPPILPPQAAFFAGLRGK